MARGQSVVVATILLGVFAFAVPAQRIYNRSQDDRAQETLKLAKEVTAEGMFTRALQNLDEVMRIRKEAVFSQAQAQMRADMSSWETWEDISQSVAAIEGHFGTEPDSKDIAKAIQELKQSREETAQASAALKAKVRAEQEGGALAVAEAGLDTLDALDEVVESLLARISKNELSGQASMDAARKAAAALKDLKKSITAAQAKFPKRASVLYLETQLELLGQEIAYIQRLAEIVERREAETKDTASLLRGIRNSLDCISKAPSSDEDCNLKGRYAQRTIADSLREQADIIKRDPANENEKLNLGEMLATLYSAGALAARGNTAQRLALYRETLEARAHSLRRASVLAAMHERIVANGAQRLALYYKGGVKPESLAQLIQALATAGIIPAIALK